MPHTMSEEADATVLLDLDGTLVDSVHLHVAAWAGALRAGGCSVPLVDIHAAIGLGSDRLLTWLLGAPPPEAQKLAADHTARFLAQADLLLPTAGAQELLDDLLERGVPHAIATSAGDEEREALLSCLDVDQSVPVVGPDADTASKPAPDLLRVACQRLGSDPHAATLVGDAPWDALAATAIGAQSIAVRCGGFADATLREAGADRIVDAPRSLVGVLG